MSDFHYSVIIFLRIYVFISAFSVLLTLIFASFFLEFQIRLFVRLDIIADYILSQKRGGETGMETLTEQERRLVRAVRRSKDPSEMIQSAIGLCEDAVNESELEEGRSGINAVVSELDTGRRCVDERS